MLYVECWALYKLSRLAIVYNNILYIYYILLKGIYIGCFLGNFDETSWLISHDKKYCRFIYYEKNSTKCLVDSDEQAILR